MRVVESINIENASKTAILRAFVPGLCDIEGEPGGATNASPGSDHTMPQEGNRMAESRPYLFRAESHLPLAEVIEMHSIPEPNSGCLLWLGSTLPGRLYGRLSYRGTQYLAHRAAWMARHGAVPKGLVVRHKCDNPACVNIEHLSLGTQADNIEDKRARNRFRSPRGEAHPFAKLTAADVREIRASAAKSAVLAPRYGLTPSAITSIRVGRRWRHV